MRKIIIVLLSASATFSASIFNNFVIEKKLDPAYFSSLFLPKMYDTPQGISVIRLSESVRESGKDNPTTYFIDASACRMLYSTSENSYKEYGGVGASLGQFNKPYGVCASADGMIFITEFGNHRISVLRNNRGSISAVRMFGGYGSGVGQFITPRMCAIDSSGALYVCDYGNERIQKMDAFGNQINSFENGTSSCLYPSSSPLGIAVMPTGKIYVSTINGMVIRYSVSGEMEKIFNAGSAGAGDSQLNAIDYDAFDNIYAIDRKNNCVYILSPDLKYIGTFSGGAPGAFSEPKDIKIIRDSGVAVITEKTGVRIYNMGTDIVNEFCTPNSFSGQGDNQALASTYIGYTLALESLTTASIKNTSGREIRRLFSSSFRRAGPNGFSWDGKDDAGSYVIPGEYNIVIKASPAYGPITGSVVQKTIPVSIKTPPVVTMSVTPPPVIDPSHSTVICNYSINEAASVNIFVICINGQTFSTVAKLAENTPVAAGSYSISWDGKLFNSIVEDNVYYFYITAKSSTTALTSSPQMKPMAVDFFPLAINDISVSRSKFNPTKTEFATADVLFTLSEEADIVLTISKENVVYRTISLERQSKGPQSVLWDGKKGDGIRAPDGIYEIRVTASQATTTGDTDTKSINVEIDTTPPAIVVTKDTDFTTHISPNEASSIGIKDSTAIKYKVNEVSECVAEIYNPDYLLVRTISRQNLNIGTEYRTLWDGKDNNGVFVPDGEYLMKISTMDDVANTSAIQETIVVDNNASLTGSVSYVIAPINTTPDIPEFNPQWTPNGESIIFLEEKERYTAPNGIIYGKYTIKKSSTSSGTVSVIADDVISQLKQSYYAAAIKLPFSGNGYINVHPEGYKFPVTWFWSVYNDPNQTKYFSQGGTVVFDNNGVAYTPYFSLPDLRADIKTYGNGYLSFNIGDPTIGSLGSANFFKVFFFYGFDNNEKARYEYASSFSDSRFTYYVESDTPIGQSHTWDDNVYLHVRFRLRIVMSGWESSKTNISARPAILPLCSPDGAKIAYIDNGSLCLMNADGNGKKVLADACVDSYSPGIWSKAGDAIYIVRSISGESPSLWKIALNGNATQITAGVNVYEPELSPDGTKFLFLSEDGNGGGVFVINADGSGLYRASPRNQIANWYASPHWSPDGSRIVFAMAENLGGNYNIYNVSSDGSGSIVQCTSSSAIDTEPLWSPDGTQIYFLSSRSGTSALWSMDADGSHQAIVSRYQRNVNRPALLTPNGTLVFAAANGSATDIFIRRSVQRMNLNAVILSPIDQQGINGNVPVRGYANDAYFDKYDLSYGVSDNPSSWSQIVSGKTPVNDAVFGTFPSYSLANGLYTILLNAYDKAGNIRKHMTRVNVLNNDTDIVKNFASSQYYVSKAQNTTIAYDLQQDASITLSVIDLDGNVVSTLTSEDQLAGSHSVVIDGSAVQDGEYICRLNIVKDARQIIQTVPIEIDNTMPGAAIVSPLQNNTIPNPHIQVIGTVQDINFSEYMLEYAPGINPTESQYIQVANSFEQLENSILGAIDTIGSGNYYTIRLRVRDRANNESVAIVNGIVDKTPPNVKITSPNNNTIAGSTLSIRATVEDQNLSSYSLSYGVGASPSEWVILVPDSYGQIHDQVIVPGIDTSSYNGLYAFRLAAKDTANNESTDIVTVFFDKTPPSTVVTPIIPIFTSENGTKYASSSHKFKLQSIPNDDFSTVARIEVAVDGGEWTAYSGIIQFTTEGEHNISYKAVDNVGNWEDAKTYSVIIDNSAPSCNMNPGPVSSYYEDSGKIYVPARNSIYFDPSDLGLIPSGVNGLYYSADGGVSYKSYAGEGLLLTKMGENTIQYYCEDNVGNISLVKSTSIILDPGAPAVNAVVTGVSYENGGITYITSAHEINLTVTERFEHDSGVAYFAYKVNDGEMRAYTYPVVFTGAGINTITWNAVDNVGNENNATKVYCIDNAPPALAVTPSLPLVSVNSISYASKNCLFSITASDELSGVKNVEISIDGSEFVSYSSPIAFSSDGLHTIDYKASDNLGNASDVQHLVVTIDGTSPSSILVSSSPLVKIGEKYYADPAWRHSINSIDELSGVKNIFLDLNGSGFSTYSGSEFTLASGGNVIRYKAIDNAGNEESVHEITINTPIPDVSPPITTATLSRNGVSLPISDPYYVNDSVTLSLSAIDPVVNGFSSGIKHSEYKLPGGNWTSYNAPVLLSGIGTEPYIISYRSIDNIDNVEAEKTITIIMDTTPPVIAVNNIASGGFYKPGIATSFTITEANLAVFSVELDGKPYASGTLITAEGVHTLTASAVDKAGNQGTKAVTFTVDGTAPVLSIGNVTNGGFYKSGIAPTFAAADLNLFTVNATLNDVAYTSGTPILIDGAYTLHVTAIDKADNNATQSIVFTVDGTPPVVTISGISNSAFYLAPVSAQVFITDQNLQVSSVTLNGEPYVSGTPISGEGQRTLIATAKDKAGNEATKAVTFGIDTQAPRITITGAVDGGFYRPALNIFYTAEDANLISLSAALDKKNYISGDPITKNGTHTLTVTAKDKYGRVTTKTITFTIDSKEPNVVVAGVQDGKYYRHPVMPIVVIHDEYISNKTITLNGDPYTPKTWVKADGNYTLVADAIDKAGNRKTVMVKFVIDTKAPVIAISGVADDVSYTNAVTPVISVTDANSDWSKTILVSCGNDDHRKHDCHDKHCGDVFVSGTPITNDGTYLLIVFAKDKADNVTAKSISFSVDTQLPVITVSGVNNGGYYKPNIAASYFAYDVNLVSCSATLDGVAYSSGTPIKNDGVHILTVKATDKAGHVAFKTVSFTIDGIQPIVSITGVDNDGCYMPGIAPQVNVIDLNLLSSTITLDNAPYTSGSAVTVDGMHTLYAYGVDRAGNFAAKTIKFTVDGTTPAITASGVENDGIYNRTVNVDVSVYDANLKRTYITLDNVPTTSHIVVSGEGAHTVHIEADDKAGNRSMKDITFIIDKTLPVVLVEGVVNNGTYTKAAIGVKLYEDNFDAARTSFKLDTQEYAQTITNGVDSGGTRFFGLSIANITNTGAHTLLYAVTDKAGNKVTGSIAFTISPFDMNAERSFYANFDISTKATYAKGDKDDYSGVKVIVSGGYMTNCVAPGVTSDDVVVKYKAQNNMRMDKGTFAMWVKPNWTKPTNNSVVSFANSSLGKVPLAIYAAKTNETILSVSGKNNSAKSITATTNWMMNRDWTYIGFTWSSEAKEHGTSEVTLSFFINGTVIGTLTMHDPAFDEISWMLLGYGKPGSSWTTFTGKLDETRVYEKALSADEIKMLFEAEKARGSAQSGGSGARPMGQSMSQGNVTDRTVSEERTGNGDLVTQ